MQSPPAAINGSAAYNSMSLHAADQQGQCKAQTVKPLEGATKASQPQQSAPCSLPLTAINGNAQVQLWQNEGKPKK